MYSQNKLSFVELKINLNVVIVDCALGDWFVLASSAVSCLVELQWCNFLDETLVLNLRLSRVSPTLLQAYWLRVLASRPDESCDNQMHVKACHQAKHTDSER